ncbi:hypothetical protein B0H13DRAFT_1855209 [Mycena leptocephala]|nr:hypothetical protein B0H13DRAFT_1855209 [Mycena leptocephala]
MSEVSILRLYYESSLLEANDRLLLAVVEGMLGVDSGKALDLRATPHPERGVTLYNLADALQTRFIQQGDDGFFGKLVHALRMRFEQRKNLKDIDETIEITKELLEARPDTRRINVINLAHFIRVEDPNDIEKIIVHQ